VVDRRFTGVSADKVKKASVFGAGDGTGQVIPHEIPK